MGKGTQCTRLAQDLDAVHVSVGDLLRAKAEKLLEEHNIDAKGHMKGGTLCPAEVVQGELENHLLKNIGDGNCKFLVDGFPRSKEQMDLFTDRVSRYFLYGTIWLQKAKTIAGPQSQCCLVL